MLDRKLMIFFIAALVMSVDCLAGALGFEKIYVDSHRNVHFVTSAANDIRLTNYGDGVIASLSPDGKTAVWLVNNTLSSTEGKSPSASELIFYRDGRIRSIRCEPFIRDYWFLRKGRNIVIDCGSLHFAGSEILYDIASGKEIERFDQATVPPEKRPQWSMSSDNYSSSE